MEEAALKRLERLKALEIGVADQVIVGSNYDNTMDTVESRAQKLLQENSFVLGKPQEAHRKANSDLKREYERRYRPLLEQTEEMIKKFVDKKIEEEINSNE